MPESIAAIVEARIPTIAKSKRKQRRVKNLVCRGGTWYVRVRLNGKSKRISTRQTDNVLAEKVARDILGKIDKGEVDLLIGVKQKQVVPTYAEFVQTYLKTVTTQKKKSTQRIDGFSLARSVAAFGPKALDTITAIDCMTLMTDLRERYSINTVKHTVTLSKAAFAYAISNKLLKENPWSLIPKKAQPRARARVRVVTDSEFAAFSETLPTADLRHIATAMRWSGLRVGELAQLVPAKHLDFVGGFVELSGDITKNGHARSIPMFPEAREAFVSLIGVRGLQCDTTLVQHYTTKTIQGFFAEVSDAMKLAERIHPHDLRRTFATRCAEEGVPMNILQKWMGHQNINVTATFYTHSDKDTGKRIAQQLAAKRKTVKVTSISAAR